MGIFQSTGIINPGESPFLHCFHMLPWNTQMEAALVTPGLYEISTSDIKVKDTLLSHSVPLSDFHF